MRVTLVAAVAQDRTIGRDNALPWRLAPDLRRFRRLTMGHPVIMGRRTYQSIGRPLDGRRNIVVTRERSFHAPGCEVAHGIDEALARCADADEAMVIGGGEIYAQSLPLADRLELTLIHARFEGDALFPEYDPAGWREVAREDHPAGESAPFAWSFVTLDRDVPARAPGAGSGR